MTLRPTRCILRAVDAYNRNLHGTIQLTLSAWQETRGHTNTHVHMYTNLGAIFKTACQMNEWLVVGVNEVWEPLSNDARPAKSRLVRTCYEHWVPAADSKWHTLLFEVSNRL